MNKHHAEDDPQTVVVTDPEPADTPPRETRRERTTAADILREIQAIPDAVAAKVTGSTSGGVSAGPRSVTFEPEPEPEPDPDDPEPEPELAPTPQPWRPKYGHPSRARRRVEIGT